MTLANGIGLLQAGYPEKEPGSVPHLPPIRRPVVPDTANVPTAKGVLNSNFRCGSIALHIRDLIDAVQRKRNSEVGRWQAQRSRDVSSGYYQQADILD